MNPPRILIAGIGNIFLGDDAFGVEVAQRMVGRSLPEGVRVVDLVSAISTWPMRSSMVLT